MNRLKLILPFIILTGLFACEPPVTFSEPQPTDTDNLSEFPNRLQGQYLSLKNNSTLSINDRVIQRSYNYYYKVHSNQLDSTTSLSGDTIIDLTTSEKTIKQRDGDSLIIQVHYNDTLFQIDYDNVIRKFNGYYFLNTRYDKTSWEVKKIQLANGQLTISSLSTKQDMENLKEITETAADTIPPLRFSRQKSSSGNLLRMTDLATVKFLSDSRITLHSRHGSWG